MKTINDFKIENGVATLVGVTYAEEAKVVEDYLKINSQIEKVTIISKDGRFFELKNGKLMLSGESIFLNPFYPKEIKAINQEVEGIKFNYTDNNDGCIMNIHEIEQKLIIQEKRIENINLLIKEMSTLLNSYLDKLRRK